MSGVAKSIKHVTPIETGSGAEIAIVDGSFELDLKPHDLASFEIILKA